MRRALSPQTPIWNQRDLESAGFVSVLPITISAKEALVRKKVLFHKPWKVIKYKVKKKGRRQSYFYFIFIEEYFYFVTLQNLYFPLMILGKKYLNTLIFTVSLLGQFMV